MRMSGMAGRQATPSPRSERRSSPAVSRRQRPDHARQRRRVRRALHRHPNLRPDRDGDRSRCRRPPAARRPARLSASRPQDPASTAPTRIPAPRNPPPTVAASDIANLRPHPRRARSPLRPRPGSFIAATSRALSAALQRRRRSTDVMTSIRFIATWLTSGYPRVLRRSWSVTRRCLPEAYPHRVGRNQEKTHDGTIVTDMVNEMWGTDMSQTVTLAEGRAYVFVAIEHANSEIVGIHPRVQPIASRRWSRSGRGCIGASAPSRPARRVGSTQRASDRGGHSPSTEECGSLCEELRLKAHASGSRFRIRLPG